MIPSLVELYQHVSVSSIVANALDETAAGEFFASKGLKVHRSAVLYIYGFGIRTYCAYEYCD
jgi:hypothetical protein